MHVGCPSKLVSIRNNRNWNRNQFRHYPKQIFCFGCFASIPKQRVSMFRLNRNKQETNRNSLIGSIFCYFIQKMQSFSVFFQIFSVFFGFFSVFSFFPVFSVCLASISKQRVSIEPKQTEDPPKQFKREYIWKFFQKFRVVSVCYETDLFVSAVSMQVRNTETNQKFFFLVSRNKPKQTRNRSCFGLFRFELKFIFVCFEDTLHAWLDMFKGSYQCRTRPLSFHCMDHEDEIEKE